MGAAYRGNEVEAEPLVGPWFSSPGGAEVQEPPLPAWEEAGELSDHQLAVFGFHTQPCRDFQNGYCQLHRAKGRASTCFCFHFDSQRRRPPVDGSTGRLLYWDVPCSSIAMEVPCSEGDSCVYAHSREEISYHPAKFKTRRCNGRGCRGESICCFAHNEAELRMWASDRYSYWAHSGAGRTAVAAAVGGSTGNWQLQAASAGVEQWLRQPPGLMNKAPVTRHKQRFCASYPDVSQCRRGAACAFAHSREEARRPLLSLEEEQQAPKALTEEFFMHKFKTLWCPIGVQHDWQTCVYAHNYQDARRAVSIGYGPRPCPFWSKKEPNADYAQRCPLALRCPFSHGAKEQLYHPLYFRTVICRDLRAKACPRHTLCAFFHRRAERRRAPPDSTDYGVPLKEEDLPEQWVQDFLCPPFKDTTTASGMEDEVGMDLGGLSPDQMGFIAPPAHLEGRNLCGGLLWGDQYDPLKLASSLTESEDVALSDPLGSRFSPLSLPLNDLDTANPDDEDDDDDDIDDLLGRTDLGSNLLSSGWNPLFGLPKTHCTDAGGAPLWPSWGPGPNTAASQGIRLHDDLAFDPLPRSVP